jgi:hypothetical protein
MTGVPSRAVLRSGDWVSFEGAVAAAALRDRRQAGAVEACVRDRAAAFPGTLSHAVGMGVQLRPPAAGPAEDQVP